MLLTRKMAKHGEKEMVTTKHNKTKQRRKRKMEIKPNLQQQVPHPHLKQQVKQGVTTKAMDLQYFVGIAKEFGISNSNAQKG